MINKINKITWVFFMVIVSMIYVFAATTTSNNNAVAQTITAGETDFLVMDFDLSVASDSVLGGQIPTAGDATVDDIDSDWTSIYYFDAADGGVWDGGADALFVDDGSVYYDVGKDTSIVGITVENTAGILTEPAGWNAFFYDAAAGATFVADDDWMGIDADADGVYTSTNDIAIDCDGEGALAAATAVIQAIAEANFVDNNDAVSEVTRIDTRADVNDDYDAKSFLLYDTSGSVCFWFDVDDSGTALTATNIGCQNASRKVEVTTVTTGMTANQVAGVLATAINGDASFTGNNPENNDVDATVDTVSVVSDGLDIDVGGAFTVAVTTPGEDLVTADYFDFRN